MQGYNLGGAVGTQGMSQDTPQQATAMPNDPRMSAAMDLVTD